MAGTSQTAEGKPQGGNKPSAGRKAAGREQAKRKKESRGAGSKPSGGCSPWGLKEKGGGLMEKQGKKIFSTILMMVGVLCIVISGGIFVSRTWHYLPDEVKKLCLVIVAAGFFGGSLYLEKEKGLRKAPVALYYLGVCFTGFSMMAFLPADLFEFPMRLCLSMLMMSIPVVLRFLRERGLADLIVQICLSDGMILCMTQYVGMDSGRSMFLMASVFTTILAGFAFYCKRELEDEKGLLIASLVAYGLHMMVMLPVLVAGLFFWTEFLFTVVPAFLILGSITAIYMAFGVEELRIFQSISMLYCGLAISAFIFRALPEGWAFSGNYHAIFFLAFFIGLVLMLVLGRSELLYGNIGLTFFYTMAQQIQFQSGNFNPEEHELCFPYGICMAVAVVIWYYFREERREDTLRFHKISACFLLIGLNSIAAWFWPEYARNYGAALWLAVGFMTVAYFMEWKNQRQDMGTAVCKSFALFVTIITLLSNKILPMVFYSEDGLDVIANFGTEYNCILVGVGIVLLGKIWYSIYQEIRIPQFVMACILLGVLLFHNLTHPALPNVLFLGIVTLIMLVVATMLKDKKYAIASAITLALVVLYLTREVWMSIAWWVYLFVAGVGLVIFAIRKEKTEKSEQ